MGKNITDTMFVLDKPLTWLYNKTARLEPVKIIRRIQLKDYAPEFGTAYLEVWVNPGFDLLEKWKDYILTLAKIKIQEPSNHEDLSAIEDNLKLITEKQITVYSELLSQGKKKTRLSTDELRDLVSNMYDTDPLFWPWVKNQVTELISEHRLGSRTAYKTFSGKEIKNV